VRAQGPFWGRLCRVTWQVRNIRRVQLRGIVPGEGGGRECMDENRGLQQVVEQSKRLETEHSTTTKPRELKSKDVSNRRNPEGPKDRRGGLFF
jgi:hypothetical protein